MKPPHLLLMLLLLLLLFLCSSARATPTLANATLTFNTTARGGLQLQLQLSVTNITSQAANSIVAAAAWERLQLREAWLQPLQLVLDNSASVVATIADSSLLLSIDLNTTVHRTTSKPVDYTLYCADNLLSDEAPACNTSDSLAVPPLPLIFVNTSRAYTAAEEAALQQQRSPVTCTSFLGQATNVFALTSLTQLMQFARQQCTVVAGTLTLANFTTLTDAQWYAAFLTFDTVEGGIVLSNLTNFGLRHIAQIQQISSGRNAIPATNLSVSLTGNTLSVAANQPVAFSLLNADNFSADGLLPSLVTDVIAGRGTLQLQNTWPPPCLTAEDAASWWWAQPGLVEIEYDPALCADASAQACPMYSPAANTCVATCSGCGALCAGGVLTTRTDLQNLQGPTPLTPCSYISGGLVITSLLQVSELDLAPLRTVTHIEDYLYISDNAYLVWLDFFANLQEVPLLALENNPWLLDARLPSLNANVSSEAVLLDNDLLCADGYPNASVTAAACGAVVLQFGVSVPALATYSLSTADLATVTSTVVNLLGSAASAEVSATNATVSSTTLTFDVTTTFANVSSLLATVAALGSNLSLHRALESMPQLGLLFINSSFQGYPLLQPTAAEQANSGWSLQTAANGYTLTLAWQTPSSADDETIYVLDTSYAASQSMVAALAAFMLEDESSTSDDDAAIVPLSSLSANASISQVDSYQLAMSAAAAGASELFIFSSQTLDSGNVSSTTLQTCTMLQGGVLVTLPATSNCLAAGQLYQLRLRAFVHGNSLQSDTVEVALSDGALSLSSLDVQTATNAINVSWQGVADTASIYAYEIQLRYAASYNYLQTQQAGQAVVLPDELFQLDTHQRLQVSATTSSVLLEGCFLDQGTGGSTCIEPFTTYLVAVRAIGLDGPGLMSSAVVYTGPTACSEPPTVLHYTQPTSADLSTTFQLQRPNVTTSVVSAFVFTFHGSQSQSGRRTFSIPEATLQQLQSPNQVFTLALDGLDPYTNYSINVSTLSIEGAEGAGVILYLQTPPITPLQPAVPEVQDLPSGMVQISWSAPVPLPGSISYYELTTGYQSDTNFGTILYQGLATSVVVPSTSVGSVSGLRLRIVSPQGSSAWSPDPLAGSTAHNDALSAFEQPGVLAGLCGGVVLLVTIMVVWRVRRRSRAYKAAEAKALLADTHLDRWEVEQRNVTMGHKIGQGAFGEVFEGYLLAPPGQPVLTETSDSSAKFGTPAFKPQRVAIKLCSGDDLKDRTDFVKEALVMKRFADPHHENVLRLLGVVTKSEPLMIITEFMARGDLRNFLRKVAPTPAGEETLSVVDLVYVASDIASGMAFLAAQKFVHRDLACRNCLVAEDMTTKVADFGLSRNLDYSEYYRKTGQALLPVRWMDPLALTECKFSTNTDVWSFGVVLYEIVTFGKIPYPGLSNMEVFQKVATGYRMEQPQGCPDEVYAIMWSCWRDGDRPSFTELETTLLDLATMMEKRGETRVLTTGKLRGKEAVNPYDNNKLLYSLGLNQAPADDDDEAATDGQADYRLSAGQLKQLLRDGKARRLEEPEQLVSADKVEVPDGYCDMRDANKPYCDMADANKPNCDVADANRAYCDMTDANKPSCDVADANKPYCDMADANKPYCDMKDAHQPAIEALPMEWDSSDLGESRASTLSASPTAPRNKSKASVMSDQQDDRRASSTQPEHEYEEAVLVPDLPRRQAQLQHSYVRMNSSTAVAEAAMAAPSGLSPPPALPAGHYLPMANVPLVAPIANLPSIATQKVVGKRPKPNNPASLKKVESGVWT